MSTTYSIGCKQCKKHLWVAQTSCGNLNFYSNDAETIDALGRFLFEHEGHDLVFDSDHHFDSEEWEEIEACDYFPDQSPPA